MQDVTENMNEQFRQLMDVQSNALKPMRIFAGVTAEAMEQFARKNYAIMGDVLDFSTRQVHLPLSSEDLTDVASAQAAQTSEFFELMKSRAAEYSDMAQSFASKVQEASESASASFK